VTSIVPELQSLAPSAIIELFELHTTLALHGTGEIYRFHSGVNDRISNGDIVWNGNRYQRFPIEVEGFEFNGKQLPRPTLRVSNLFSVISSILLNVNELTPGNDLIGAKVIRIRTCARYLDAINFENNQNPYGIPDPSAEAPREIYYVDRKVSENRSIVEFELAAALDLTNVKLPGRQCISGICQWEYRGPECGYTGSNVFDENDNPGNLVAATNFPAGTTTLTAGQSLLSNQFLVSSNGWYKAVMQEDGNFVVYSKALKAVWSTLTYTKGLSTFIYQDDGNLVVYDAFNRPTWNSNTQNVAAITALTFTKLLPDKYPRGDEDALQLVAAPNFPAGNSSVVSTAAPRTRELWPGESLTSSNGWYQLLMQRDGNLVVYNKANDPVWNTGTGEPSKAVFQEDGNLVLYRYSDGKAIWNAGSYLQPTSFTPTANFPTGTGIILAGNTSASKLTIGQNLYSPNGWYRLTMQNDGNLVLYSKGTIFTGPPSQNYNIAVWSTDTYGSNATYAHFQDDGNLVLYTSSNVPVWKSNNGSYPQYAGKKLVLQNDGNLVIYGIGSSTSTTTVPAPNLPTGTGQILCSNTESSKLYKGQTLYSENGWYRLTMQTDGNLVIYDKAGTAVWNTGTYNTAAHFAYFQADGNLVLLDNTGVTPIWWLNKGSYGQWTGYRWKLEKNGDFVLYSANNTALWRSATGTSAEPSVTKVNETADTPLWHTVTGKSAEPGAAVFPQATLALSNNGTLTITAGGVTRFTNAYSNTDEPQIETETGDNRQHAFLWEIFGSADTQSGQTKTVSRIFAFGLRSVTFSFTGTANFTLPAEHYSNQTKSWTLTSATYVSSSGKWYLDEWLELFLETSESNPFRNHPNGVVTPVGRQYRINGVLSNVGSLLLGNDGNLVQYDSNNSAIWSSNYSSNIEPKVPGDGGDFVDICGKRLTSCEARFGTNVDLPFGSFPGVGQYFT
jgi:lambda family phage minor tail protein L